MVNTDVLMARYLWVKKKIDGYALDERYHVVLPIEVRKKLLELMDKIPEMLDEISRLRKEVK